MHIMRCSHSPICRRQNLTDISPTFLCVGRHVVDKLAMCIKHDKTLSAIAQAEKKDITEKCQ